MIVRRAPNLFGERILRRMNSVVWYYMQNILKPARYIGHEWNAVHKEWDACSLKVALCFPDIYEIGMSHLGMRILYGILNQEKDVLCERVFAPWTDMEEKLRKENMPIRSLESGKDLREFDIVGFSLQYEMNLPDVLNILDLGKIPVYSKDRSDADPLVIAGGGCAFNPEVMADFIDAFVIGEAEEALLEIANLVQGSRFKVQGCREVVLKGLAEIKGVYVPALRGEGRETRDEGPAASPLGERGTSIEKRVVSDLDNSYFPTSPVVPYIQIVHDRVSIEIMRGCPHKCKFCQACKIYSPWRIRSVKRILEIAEEAIKNTGYEEIGLLSLSTGDYPHLEELAAKLEEKFKSSGIRISLPSLRVGSFKSDKMGSIVKKHGMTLAPEAGSERLRDFLNKKIKNEDIIEQAKLAVRSGWSKVKLYFMMGLPSETYEDLDAIIELASLVKNANISVSPFIPKPHSDFENEPMNDIEPLRNKEEYLRAKARAKGRGRSFRMDFHNLKMSRIEGVISRGDRKVGEVIYRAWCKGARFQAWTEFFNYKIWDECFAECGVDPDSYLRARTVEDWLPWKIVDSG